MFKDLLKIPYDEKSWDCVALSQEVFRRYGQSIPVSDAARTAVESIDTEEGRGNMMLYIIEKTWDLINDPQEPCLVVIFRAGFVTHVGVYIGGGKFIHISEAKKYATIESLDNKFYANKKFYIYNSNKRSV